MKISELIAELEALKEFHGDLPVYTYKDDYEEVYYPGYENVRVLAYLNAQPEIIEAIVI